MRCRAHSARKKQRLRHAAFCKKCDKFTILGSPLPLRFIREFSFLVCFAILLCCKLSIKRQTNVCRLFYRKTYLNLLYRAVSPGPPLCLFIEAVCRTENLSLGICHHSVIRTYAPYKYRDHRDKNDLSFSESNSADERRCDRK